MVQFQTISILTPQRVTVISEGRQKGGGGNQKPKLIKESMKVNWDFQRRQGGGGGGGEGCTN